ncbi:MAG: hypothetical protein QM699_11475 [Amaricoccus sp.]|uniref:hypothetical protein n=1 Tax=Amaricoccus sp. TaxID=1872485 RepID=UPI0039E26AD2
MGHFSSYSMNDTPDAGLSADEVQLRAMVERERNNPVKHIGDVDARVTSADLSKFSGAGFTSSSGGAIVGREIAMNDRYRDPATGMEMTVASALSLGLLQKG